MQDFEFRVYEAGYATPSVMLVLTRDADSALNLAERILSETKGCSHIDVWMDRRYLFTVEAPQAAASHAARRAGAVSRSSFWSGFRKSGLRFGERSALHNLQL